MNTAWTDLHNRYKTKDWSTKPSIFAETAINYFPAKAKVLELGAGLGQDGRFFAQQDHTVTCTDLEEDALEERLSSWPDDEAKKRMAIHTSICGKSYRLKMSHLMLCTPTYLFIISTTKRRAGCSDRYSGC